MAVTLSPFIQVTQVSAAASKSTSPMMEGTGMEVIPETIEEFEEGLQNIFDDDFDTLVYEYRVKGISDLDAKTRARIHTRARNPFTPSIMEAASTGRTPDGVFGDYGVEVAVQK